jgi:acylphosphatase
MSRIRVHLFVSGRVQGVFFREFTRRAASARGVTGSIRNLPDGRVEGIFEGEEEAVRALIGEVRQGPPHARVSDVEWVEERDRDEFEDFQIVY